MRVVLVLAGAEAVDVQRSLGEAGTERADDLLEALVEPPRRRADLLAPRPRFLGAMSTVSSLRFSTTMRPPIITECTPEPSSVWTIALTGSLVGIQLM